MNFNFSQHPEYILHKSLTKEVIDLYGIKIKFLITEKINEDKVCAAFRLPLLPSGFSYGEEAISGNTLYVAWEESSFFKTGRAGFITVDLKPILQTSTKN